MFARELRTAYAIHSRRITRCTRSSRVSLHGNSQIPQREEVAEIDIPVPWGKVAGKLWGSRDKQPVLAMHGWQDNAASFDKLAPLLLTRNRSILAIDLPGHGLSSWLPPGFIYNEIVYLMLIKRIQKHFGWKKIKLIAHSLSAMTTYWYAATFPQDLQYVVALDFVKFPSIDATTYSSYLANAINMFFKLENGNGSQPRYTYDELIQKGLESYVLSDMDEATYKILTTRGSTRKEDGKYVINRDPRLRIMPIHSLVAQEHQEKYARLIACPYLIIKGSQYYGEDEKNFYRIIDIMRSVNANVHLETLPCEVEHHFHLTHAEDTAAVIDTFLQKYD